MLTQAEITRAYMEGRDIACIYRRRLMTAYVVATLALAPFALLGLYLVKCLLGIDVYPDSHLTDWLL